MTTATALQTATAFNGTIVNTGVLCELFDGVSAYFGVLSQDKKEFFPLHGIADDFCFNADTVLPVYSDSDFWEDTNAFELIIGEHEARKAESAASVTNDSLWEEIKRVHSTKEGMFSA